MLQKIGLGILSAVAFAALLGASNASAQATGGLSVVVIEGDGARNSIDEGSATRPVVEVRDGQGAPLSEASVTFTAPTTGPSVMFFGAVPTTTVLTDEQGRAAPPSVIPNAEPGPFVIRVEAAHQSATAAAEINQTNAGGPPKRKQKYWGPKTIGLLIGAAATVAVVIASR